MLASKKAQNHTCLGGYSCCMLFTPQEEWSGFRACALQKGIQRALRERARVEDVESLLQPEWHHDALTNQLLRMRLGFSAGDLADAVRALGSDSRGMIAADILENALSESCFASIERVGRLE